MMKHSKSPRDFGCPGCSLLKANLDAITRGKRAGSRFTIAPLFYEAVDVVNTLCSIVYIAVTRPCYNRATIANATNMA